MEWCVSACQCESACACEEYVSKDFILSEASVYLDSPESATSFYQRRNQSHGAACVCCAGATVAERTCGSLYVVARELNPQGGLSSSSARTRWKRLKAAGQCVHPGPQAVAPNSGPCIQEVLMGRPPNSPYQPPAQNCLGGVEEQLLRWQGVLSQVKCN